MLVTSSGMPIMQTITDADIRAIAKDFGITVREDFLN